MSEYGPSQAKAAARRLDLDREAKAPNGAANERRDFLIVGIGASAGGLEPCKSLVAAIPADSGMAYIIVQHLDPTHESLMVELLAGHTKMSVSLAQHHMPVERGHIYVIPPSAYLSIRDGAFQLSRLDSHQGARLPFDHLLRSMAKDCGRRGVCVILSGGGSDGSVGLKTIHDGGGFVIAQDPDEAGHDGMPRSAIGTGAVDLVLAVADIPAALSGYRRRLELTPIQNDPIVEASTQDRLPEIIELLRTKTAQDFKLYKPGTLGRRIERRMAMVGIKRGDFARYLGHLRGDGLEVELLAKDLLIHVTSFFRDPDVFASLSATIIADLVRELAPSRPIRVWIPGCSTGEETYSLAMLFHEQFAQAGRELKLQIFASDIDEDSIAAARTGFYPATIVDEISPARLDRFFSKERDGYRVSAELRASVVFTVQDMLADPPFSRIDMVSCRNLLIYLSPEAQEKVVTLFHFAIRPGGILVLGKAETVGKPDGRFDVISKKEGLYRHVGTSRFAEFSFATRVGYRTTRRPGPSSAQPSSQATPTEICRDLMMETYAPAAVLIDGNNQCLFFFGRTDDYLKTAHGQASNDVLLIAREGVRTKLRSAIQEARRDGARVVVTGGRMVRDRVTRMFCVAAEPVPGAAEGLALVCFLDEPVDRGAPGIGDETGGSVRAAGLEEELERLRAEFESAIRSHELFGEEQKAVNEEALSVNEEYQSTNEELISSKEELQSLNEELSALNGQLQETLERQRTTSDDLQNVLYSTDVATLFLDVELRIRFFTPTVSPLFNVIPSDIGRPLSDLASMALDLDLSEDARRVLRTAAPIEREITSSDGAWFSRRILPYRAHGETVEGVVITFTDVSDRKRTASALEAAKQEAERADAAKSRFLAAASHDLRQPLQTLTLLHSLMHKADDLDQSRAFLARSKEALAAMSGMLDTLLDINQIEAGAVTAEIVNFPVDRLLDVVREEFKYQAEARNLGFKVVPCGLSIETDPRLLEQMVRNLLSNALKYTKRGKVLLGCRRHDGALSLEIWDTGIGIPGKELRAIFDEYHQVGNAARDKGRGLGLGLAIVRRLGDLLGHHVHVRSHRGRGSVFGIDIALASAAYAPGLPALGHNIVKDAAEGTAGTILIVEDDTEMRDLLRLWIGGDGHATAVAADGEEALGLLAERTLQPDIILADYNLPGMNGLEMAVRLRGTPHRDVPVVILTGDISTGTLRAIAAARCAHLNKPVQAPQLTKVIQGLLQAGSHPLSSATARVASSAKIGEPIIFIVDDDDGVRAAIRDVLEAEGRIVEDFATSEAFLDTYEPGREACLLIDAYLPGMDGIRLLELLAHSGRRLPAIMITGGGDVSTAVRAMKAGAYDFLEKPIGREDLLAGVEGALGQGRDAGEHHASGRDAMRHLASLTARQRQVMDLVLAGHPSKNIAADLGISQRTVENHRATIMKRTGAKSLPALARLSFTAALMAETPGV